MELLRSMKKNERKAYFTADIGSGLVWGLRQGMIEVNTFNDGTPTSEVVLNRLRNALSHPTVMNLDVHFPSSGYSTIRDGSDSIHQYCFVNSPDIRDSGHPKRYPQREAAERGLERARGDGGMPREVGVITYDGQFCFGLGDKPFARIFKIRLTPEEIHTLVIGLSNHLAQSKEKDWDGVTIARLVA